MDEFEFNRLLQLFPIVRSPDYHASLKFDEKSHTIFGRSLIYLASQHRSHSRLGECQEACNEEGEKPKDQGSDLHDAFWTKLKLAAEQKIGKIEAERFCNSFQQLQSKLVNEELSLDAGRSFLDSFSSTE